MKLRNKKTGQEGNFIINKDHFECVDLDYVPEYRNLAELNEEWEDYEEPKEYYYLNEYLELDHEMWTDTEFDNKLKALGNYFETKEEAENAVEKLKAWKRLKDKGFKFAGWNTALSEISFEVPESFFPIKSYNISCITDETEVDLDLLFGDEE